VSIEARTPRGERQPNNVNTQQPQQRAGGSESSNPNVISSRVPRKSRDANQEFLDMWRMSMMMEQEERRRDRMESRQRQEELTGLITALVGGIARAFGAQPLPSEGVQPLPSNGNKKRKRKDYNSSDDESND
jgi:hypothetical protein